MTAAVYLAAVFAWGFAAGALATTLWDTRRKLPRGGRRVRARRAGA